MSVTAQHSKAVEGRSCSNVRDDNIMESMRCISSKFGRNGVQKQQIRDDFQ